MVKTAKTTKRTISKKKTAKEATYYEKWKFMNSWKENEASPTFIEKLTEDMLNHFEDKEQICFENFLSEKGIYRATFDAWAEKNSNLKEAQRFVMQRIGTQREKLAMFKKFECNPATLHMTMRFYNGQWRKAYDEESDLKLRQSEKGSSETKVVVIEKFSDLESTNTE